LSTLDWCTTPAFQDAYAYIVAAGQFISDRNVTRKDTVVVLGGKTAADLFGTGNAIGQMVKIRGKAFTVIGVLERKGGAFMGFSPDDVMVMPITTFQDRLFSPQIIRGENAVQAIAIKVASKDALSDVKSEAEAILRKRHRIAPDKKDDFAVIKIDVDLGTFAADADAIPLVLLNLSIDTRSNRSPASSGWISYSTCSPFISSICAGFLGIATNSLPIPLISMRDVSRLKAV